MPLHNLKPAAGSTHHKKRVGRGQGSGYGKRSGRGNNGAQSRSGYKIKRGFEGGQMPIQRRVPKRGFKNRNRISYKVFNLGQIDHLMEKYALEAFSVEALQKAHLINKNERVKILSNGDLKSKASFKVNAVSKSAREAIEDAGGSVELIDN